MGLQDSRYIEKVNCVQCGMLINKYDLQCQFCQHKVQVGEQPSKRIIAIKDITKEVNKEGEHMTLDELVEQGIVKVCMKHDEEKPIYFDATLECPVCKLEAESEEKQVGKKTKKKVAKEPEKKPVEVEQKHIGQMNNTDFVDKIQAWWSSKSKGYKISLVIFIVFAVWLLLNFQALLSYLH